MNRIWNLPVHLTAKYSTDIGAGTAPEDFVHTSIADQATADTKLCDDSWPVVAGFDTEISFYGTLEGAMTEVWRQGNVPGFGNMYINLALQNSDEIVGIALNGVFLFAATTELKYDAFFPKSSDPNVTPVGYTFDVCLGTFET